KLATIAPRDRVRLRAARPNDPPAAGVGLERILVQIDQSVLGIEQRDARPNAFDLVGLHLGTGRDDQLVPDLARARGRAVQRAASASALAVDHVRADPRARRLVPDLAVLEQQEDDL